MGAKKHTKNQQLTGATVAWPAKWILNGNVDISIAELQQHGRRQQKRQEEG